MIVQIYEIQSPEEAEKCIEAGVDHVGSVVLSEKEWRKPGLRETIGVSEGTRVKNSLIPLFQDRDTLFKMLDYYRPDFIHFCESLTDDHGKEIDLTRFVRIQREIKEEFPEVGIIRSIPIPAGPVSGFPALDIAGRLEPVTDLFLTDTWLGKEPIEGFIGITGKTCERETAGKLIGRGKIPVILAGGLSPENVYDALMELHPAGADSCTLTNKADGEGRSLRFQKDFKKVKRFVEEVRRAERDFNEKKG